MSHPRQLIRHAVAAQLTGATAAGTRVFKTRVLPYRRELPAVAVYTFTETVDVDVDSSPRELKRTLDLVIEGAVQATSAENPDDLLDALALEIETALHADPTFGNTAADAVLSATELEVVAEGEQLIGVVKLTYRVEYYAFADTFVPPDDFNTANVRYNLSNEVHPDNEARDIITTGE